MNLALRRIAGPVFLFGVWIVFFAHAFFYDRIFSYRDLFFFHYPLQRYWISAVSAGHLPFLNTGLNNGQPLLGNPNYAIFYPFKLIFFLLPFDTAWNLSIAGHVLWAALGIYWLTRTLGCEVLASLAGAITFAFSGPLLSSITYHNLVIANAWLPWIVGLAIAAWKKNAPWTVLTALALATQILAGEPTVQLATGVLLLAGWLAGLSRSQNWKTPFLRGALIAGLALMLAAIQLIPAMAWLPHSSRGSGLDFRLSAAYWSLHPARLVEFLVPNFYGNVMGNFAEEFWGGKYADGGYPYMLKIYAGWLPLVVAPMAWRRPWGRPALLVFFGALLLSLGRWLPGYDWLFKSLPLLHVIRYPEKLLSIAVFGLAVATAIGMSGFMRRKSHRSPFFIVIALLFLLAGIYIFRWPNSLTVLQHEKQDYAILQAALIGSLALTLIAFSKRWIRVVSLCIPAVILLDLTSVTWEIPETQPGQLLRKSPLLLEKVPEIRDTAILHLGEDQADLYFAGGIQPERFMFEALHPLVGIHRGLHYGATNDIDRMGWRLSSGRQAFIHKNFPGPKPLEIMRQAGIQWVVSLSPIIHPQLLLEKLIPLVNEKRIYVYRLFPPAFPLVRWENGEGHFDWQQISSHHLLITVRANQAGQLLVSRNALPGWRYKCDGNWIHLARRDDGWLHLPVTMGEHHLELIYHPPGLLVGVFLTSLGILAALATLLFHLVHQSFLRKKSLSV